MRRKEKIDYVQSDQSSLRVPVGPCFYNKKKIQEKCRDQVKERNTRTAKITNFYSALSNLCK